MTTLADKAILSGADNHPPMLEKDMYDSWKNIMKLYMMNRQHGRMILESVENEAIQADCDVKATNIILQGLPPELYALVRNHKVTKELWERIQLLMQGTSLTKQERECKLYDEFDKFAYKKGETLREFYLRFTMLLNDMNIYNMKLEQFQVNTKFLNTLPPEWSKFVTDVKMVRDLHTTNIDQLHAYLGQHEFHANEGRQTSLAAGTSRIYIPGASGSNYGKQRTVICYNYNGEGHMSKQCTKPKRKRDDSWFKVKVLLVQAQASGQILHEDELAFLADLGILEFSLMENLSHYGSDALAESNVVNNSENEITSDSNIIPYSQYVTESQQVAVQNRSQATQTVDNASVKSVEIDHLKQTLSEHLKEKESLMQTVTLLKNDFKKEESRNIDREIALEKRIKQLDNIVFKRDQSAQTLEPNLYAGNVIMNANAIVIPESEETLMLAEEIQPTLSSRPTIVKVPKELPKVSMVNTSLKKLKYHLAALKDLFNTFDQYLIDELSEVQNGFHQMEQAVEQHRLELKTFEVKINQVLNENEQLLEQVISKDIVNIIVNSSMDNASVKVNACEKCLKLETELLNKTNFIEKETYDKLFKSFTTLEKHCISLEVDSQLNQEIFQRDNSVSNQSAPSFD
ncbi:hypothetical protein Tco_1320635 [Tanacetum coccineum]